MRIDIANYLNYINSVDGWLTPVEQIGLLHAPAQVQYLQGALVEIGSFKGKSTICLGLGSVVYTNQKKPVYAIDPFELEEGTELENLYERFYFEAFNKNIQNVGLTNFVKAIKKYSYDAYKDCPNAISFLFIDGDHSYPGVLHDIEHYATRVVAGGLVAFHDYSNSENVKKAVDELIEYPDFEYVCDYDSLRIIRKIY